jgi:transcriptional regulator with XRE-family HTH domain
MGGGALGACDDVRTLAAVTASGPAAEFQAAYGGRVREARTAAGITQTVLAQRLGLTRASVANIEAGRQGASAFSVIVTAGILGCDPHWLLTGQALMPQSWPGLAETRRRWARRLHTLAEDIESYPLA